MRVLSRRKRLITTRNRFENGPGVSVYIGPAGSTDPTKIEYRRIRLLSSRHAILPVGSWNPGTLVMHDAIVAQAACAAGTVNYSLPAAYTDTSFCVQLRRYKDGLEHDTIIRSQCITVDASQDGSTTIDGTASITGEIKLDGGGLRVEFLWFAALTGVQPTEFVLRRTSGPTSPADVSVTTVSQIPQEISVTGLQDAGAYTFSLIAKNGSTEATLGTVNFTADSSGPNAVESLTATEC